MSAEQLIAFHVGLNAAIERWAQMITTLLDTGDIVAYHAALGLQEIQPGANGFARVAKEVQASTDN